MVTRLQDYGGVLWAVLWMGQAQGTKKSNMLGGGMATCVVG